jgi:hypothetical protein
MCAVCSLKTSHFNATHPIISAPPLFCRLIPLLSLLCTASYSACTQYCAAGDTLSQSSCIATITYVCSAGYSSSSGGPCVAAPCSGGGVLCSTDFGSSNGGLCAFGGRQPATDCTVNHRCSTSCVPPYSGYLGDFCLVGSTSWCYSSTITVSACPGGTLNSAETQCTSNTPVQVVYSCAGSGYSLHPSSNNPTTCRRTYGATTITSEANVHRLRPVHGRLQVVRCHQRVRQSVLGSLDEAHAPTALCILDEFCRVALFPSSFFCVCIDDITKIFSSSFSCFCQ